MFSNRFKNIFYLAGCGAVFLAVSWTTFTRPEKMRVVAQLTYDAGVVSRVSKAGECYGHRGMARKCFLIETSDGFSFLSDPNLFQIGARAVIRYGYADGHNPNRWQICAPQCEYVKSGNDAARDLFGKLVDQINFGFSK